MHFKNDKVFLPIGKNASSAITLSFLGVDCVATKWSCAFFGAWLRLCAFFIAQNCCGDTFYRKEEKKMPDYEKMYFELFNGVTDIIEDLKKLQQKAEENYIEAKEEN